MDIFTEQIVKRKLSSKDLGISFAASLGGVVLVLISVFILFPLTGVSLIPLVVLVGSIYGIYWVVTSRNLEFEYSVTNGDLTVDKIINKKRRKRVISFDVHNTEEMGKYDARRMAQRQVEKVLMAAETDTGENAWYIIVRTAKYGRTLLVFSPNEKVLDGIKAGMPRQMRFDVFGRN